MKKITIVFFILLFAITFAHAQTKAGETKKSTTIDATNMLDAQTNLYKDYLGDSLATGKDPKSINGFLELVEESDLSPEEKKQAKDFYHDYSANPNAEKLDSLHKILNHSEKKPAKP